MHQSNYNISNFSVEICACNCSKAFDGASLKNKCKTVSFSQHEIYKNSKNCPKLFVMLSMTENSVTIQVVYFDYRKNH